ncbi:MAG TPA: sodium:alanine symporter family protein, partial [Lachnospiraceae bacterium]|nr:sodium:alanine symporter family protein [Lachnospiraceae bacterium]
MNGLCAGLFGIGTVTQVNGIVKSINDYFNPEGVQSVNLPALGGFSWITVIASIVIATLVAIIIFGGIKRISKVASVVVPFMAILYFILGILVIILNITEVPAAIAIIIEAAFDPKAFTGGIVGSVFVAMQKGMSRGIFSNEAGLGSAPIAAAAAKTKEPVRQGLISMTGTFIDTIIICNITGIAIVLTGAWQIEGFEGVQITTYAFQKALPFPDEITAFIIMICLVFFAFTSILGWNYYSERCMTYLNGGKSKTIKIYNALYTIAVFAGPYMTVTAVWTISDILNGLMALPNMIALFALSGVI